jgi:hypothetical protein
LQLGAELIVPMSAGRQERPLSGEAARHLGNYARRSFVVCFELRDNIALSNTAHCVCRDELSSHSEHHQFVPGQSVRFVPGSNVIGKCSASRAKLCI